MNLGLSDFGSLKHYIIFFLVVKLSSFCYLGINECPGTLGSQDSLTLGSIQDLASLRQGHSPLFKSKKAFQTDADGKLFPNSDKKKK